MLVHRGLPMGVGLWERYDCLSVDLNEVLKQEQAMKPIDQNDVHRKGAAGKAFLVYLGSGSILMAVVAYFIFNAMGC